ncbi:MAG: PilT/PilU family type 4a pilus ATPase [Pseudomonadota bacterium]
MMQRLFRLIKQGVKDGYSDIHISGDHPLVYRKDGKISFYDGESFSPEQMDAVAREILTQYELAILRARYSVDLARTIEHIRVRINLFVTVRGLSMAIRLLPGKIPNFNDLNLHPSLTDYCGLSSGLILICGATGSGKSTTIAAMISEINRHYSRHIITLEDPVEYRFTSSKSHVEQREIGNHVPSFDQGLRDALREDPDVIMVGELREPETIRLTLNAVESGHLVIASLHATNSEDALYRICNSFASDAQEMVRTQLSSVLTLLVVQKLELFERFGFRVPCISILKGVMSVKTTIRDNRFAQIESIIQTGRGDGMFTMDRYGSEYIASRTKLTPPTISFKPSPEFSRLVNYRSTLIDQLDETLIRPSVNPGKDSVKKPSRKADSNDESLYIIEDHSSMEDVLSELGHKGAGRE